MNKLPPFRTIFRQIKGTENYLLIVPSPYTQTHTHSKPNPSWLAPQLPTHFKQTWPGVGKIPTHFCLPLSDQAGPPPTGPAVLGRNKKTTVGL